MGCQPKLELHHVAVTRRPRLFLSPWLGHSSTHTEKPTGPVWTHTQAVDACRTLIIGIHGMVVFPRAWEGGFSHGIAVVDRYKRDHVNASASYNEYLCICSEERNFLSVIFFK